MVSLLVCCVSAFWTGLRASRTLWNNENVYLHTPRSMRHCTGMLRSLEQCSRRVREMARNHECYFLGNGDGIYSGTFSTSTFRFKHRLNENTKGKRKQEKRRDTFNRPLHS